MNIKNSQSLKGIKYLPFLRIYHTDTLAYIHRVVYFGAIAEKRKKEEKIGNNLYLSVVAWLNKL